MFKWLRRLFSPKPNKDSGSPAVRSLVDFPSPRECPADVRRQLRQIAPDLEIIYFGIARFTNDAGQIIEKPEWWLGRVKHTRPRFKIGARMAIAAQTYSSVTDVAKYKHGLLGMQGFGYICEFHRDPDGGILDYARYLRWQKENEQMDAVFEDALFASDDARRLDAAIRLARDKNQADSRGIWKHATGRGTIYSH